MTVIHLRANARQGGARRGKREGISERKGRREQGGGGGVVMRVWHAGATVGVDGSFADAMA